LGVPEIEKLLQLGDQGAYATTAGKRDRAENYRSRYLGTMQGAQFVTKQEIEDAKDALHLKRARGAQVNMSAEDYAYQLKYGHRPEDMEQHGRAQGGKYFLDKQQEQRFRKMREASLKDLAGSHISPEQMKKFREHIYDPNFNWFKELESARNIR